MNPVLQQLLLSRKRPIIFDSFTRSDAIISGNAETGQAWSVLNGNWRVSDGKAYSIAPYTSGDEAVIDIGIADKYLLSCQITDDTDNELVFRCVDHDNYLFAGIAVGVFAIYKKISNVYTLLGSYGSGVAGTVYTVSVRVSDRNIVLIIDGRQVLSVDTETFMTATKVGIRSGNKPNCRFDNFKAEVL